MRDIQDGINDTRKAGTCKSDILRIIFLLFVDSAMHCVASLANVVITNASLMNWACHKDKMPEALCHWMTVRIQ